MGLLIGNKLDTPKVVNIPDFWIYSRVSLSHIVKIGNILSELHWIGIKPLSYIDVKSKVHSTFTGMGLAVIRGKDYINVSSKNKIREDFSKFSVSLQNQRRAGIPSVKKLIDELHLLTIPNLTGSRDLFHEVD